MASIRWILIPAVFAAACGGDKGNGGDGGGSNADALPTIDAAPAPYCTARSGQNLKLTPVVTGLNKPVALAAPPGDPRLFILERDGLVRVVKDGNLLPTPYLDISSKVKAVGDEQGLLGLAFHPQFAQNGKFYVFYSAETGATGNGPGTLEEYTATPTADTANPTGRLLFKEARFSDDNHNGGTVTFGPDGFLYVSLGDGGAGGNFHQTAQDPQTRKAKILRLDVDHGDPYGIPAGNPWAAGGGVPEMFVWGLRNPWRFTIDQATGDVYIGDVGQEEYEEIDLVPAGTKGQNFGWGVFEGTTCFTADPDGNAGCNNPSAYTMPLVTIDRRSGQPDGDWGAIVGGAVYRGTCMPDHVGEFFFGDYRAGEVRTLKVVGGQATQIMDRTPDLDPTHLLQQGGLASFGTDGYNELYVMAIITGRVYRIEAE